MLETGRDIARKLYLKREAGRFQKAADAVEDAGDDLLEMHQASWGDPCHHLWQSIAVPVFHYHGLH